MSNKKTYGLKLILLTLIFSFSSFFLFAYLAIPSEVTLLNGQNSVIHTGIKDITVNSTSSEKVIVGGHSVGVRLDVKGVLIVGLEEIETFNQKKLNPGIAAGIQIGDAILEIDGKQVLSADDVKKIIRKTDREIVSLKIKRHENTIIKKISPVYSIKENCYKLGLWVKEETAGIGTLTFYQQETGYVGALGHGITDNNTGTILNVADGELVNSSVKSVKQGKVGFPGQIKGIFYESDDPLGKLISNTEFGVFGKSDSVIENPLYDKAIEIGYRDEVEESDAFILTTLEGNKIENFKVTIEKKFKQREPSTKSMIIRVTDEDLLKRTGGIVQGMSGSPIIQNGKLIGAITHVFVNEPECGYGIYIEWMLSEINNISDGQETGYNYDSE